MLLSPPAPKKPAAPDTDLLPLLGLMMRAEIARQRKRPEEAAFAALVHKPFLVQADPATPVICEVVFVTERSDFIDRYDFEPPPLTFGSVTMFAVPAPLPDIEWEY
jgi:hypothetical protein